MNVNQAAATVAALADDQRLVRVARRRLQQAVEEAIVFNSVEPTDELLRDIARARIEAGVDLFAPLPIDEDGLLNPNGPCQISLEVGTHAYQVFVIEARAARGEGATTPSGGTA